jgi:pimeloyl-ACP methyl ester carboxylesterase
VSDEGQGHDGEGRGRGGAGAGRGPGKSATERSGQQARRASRALTSAADRTVPAEHSFASGSGAQGYLTDLDGPVHWVHWGARGGDPAPGPGPARSQGPEPLVLVHGLGGSHLNWTLVASAWAADRDVRAVDLPGFGLSPGHPRDSSVQGNTDVLVRFVEEVVGRPVVLVGNSMGGMISALTASRRPDLVSGLVLVDPALPLVRLGGDRVVASRFALFALPFLGELTMRKSRQTRSAEQLTRDLLELCFADPSRIDPEVVRVGVELARARRGQEGVEESFMRAARSLLKVLAARGSYWSMLGSLRQPVLLLHGEKDRLVDVASAREAARRCPGWEFHVLPDTGHTPQLEVPDRVVGLVTDWLDRHTGSAVASAPTGTDGD